MFQQSDRWTDEQLILGLSHNIVWNLYKKSDKCEDGKPLAEQDKAMYEHGLKGKTGNKSGPVNSIEEAFVLFLQEHRVPTGRQKGAKWRMESTMRAVKYDKGDSEDIRKHTIQHHFNKRVKTLFDQGFVSQ